jgi:hypothetical protein
MIITSRYRNNLLISANDTNHELLYVAFLIDVNCTVLSKSVINQRQQQYVTDIICWARLEGNQQQLLLSIAGNHVRMYVRVCERTQNHVGNEFVL